MWPEASEATRTIVEDGFAPLLAGQSVLQNGELWQQLRQHCWWYGVGGIASFAVAAVDIAMWDLKGVVLGKPLVELLGGAVHERLPAVASGHADRENLDAMVEEVGSWLNRGLHGVKIGFGKRGNARLGYEHARDVEFVRRLRHALGPDRMIMIDVGNTIHWDAPTAIERVRAMEVFDIEWIEEPLGPWNPEGYAELRARTSTPVAYGEREWTVRGYSEILHTETVDVIGIDPGRAEGITGFLKVCEEVSTAGRQANAHAWSSAIVTAASLAVSCNQSVCRLFEVKPKPNPMQHEIVTQPIEPSHGWVYPLSKPGLGIEVIDEVVDFYRSDRVKSR
jgi:L-alanine-DL-glutamate epimerase-like enolase superfamily enzyme